MERHVMTTQSWQPWVLAEFRKRLHRASVAFALGAALVLWGCLLMLTGCAASQAAPVERAVALVIDKGQTSALADGATDCAMQVFEPILADGGYMVIDVASSKPTVVCSQSVRPANNTDPVALESRWEKDAAFEEAREIDATVPAAEEMDLLEAISQAADELRTHAPDATERTVYVASSGLQTAGLLDLTNRGPYGTILDWDFDELLARIADDSTSGEIKAEAFPDLSGISVKWMGFGDLVAGAQGEVPVADEARLKDLWSRVLAACGATFDPAEDFISCPTSAPTEATAGETDAEGDGTTPEQQVKPVNREDLKLVTPVIFEETLTTAPATFDENVLGFKPGSDEYRADRDYVLGVIEPFAAKLAKDGTKVVILGTTANDGRQSECIDLGKRRAQRFRDDSVACGVDPSQITICSAGYEGTNVRIGDEVVDFYHDNYDADGNWDEAVARTNRAIHVIPESIASDVMARFSV